MEPGYDPWDAIDAALDAGESPVLAQHRRWEGELELRTARPKPDRRDYMRDYMRRYRRKLRHGVNT